MIKMHSSLITLNTTQSPHSLVGCVLGLWNFSKISKFLHFRVVCKKGQRTIGISFWFLTRPVIMAEYIGFKDSRIAVELSIQSHPLSIIKHSHHIVYAVNDTLSNAWHNTMIRRWHMCCIFENHTSTFGHNWDKCNF